MKREILIIVPVYQPDPMVPDFIGQLQRKTRCRILVINDGSNAVFAPLFRKIQNLSGITLLQHDGNQGKGAALKTAFRWCRENCPELLGVITVDSDGQHTLPDVLRMIRELTTHPDSLILGCRDFSLACVPWKSRFGNRIVSWWIRKITGIFISDTQTGLRGIPRDLLFSLIECQGRRFEFETAMLLTAVEQQYDVQMIPISTIYHPRNRQTHFRTGADTLLVFQTLLNRKQTGPE